MKQKVQKLIQVLLLTCNLKDQQAPLVLIHKNLIQKQKIKLSNGLPDNPTWMIKIQQDQN